MKKLRYSKVSSTQGFSRTESRFEPWPKSSAFLHWARKCIVHDIMGNINMTISCAPHLRIFKMKCLVGISKCVKAFIVFCIQPASWWDKIKAKHPVWFISVGAAPRTSFHIPLHSDFGNASSSLSAPKYSMWVPKFHLKDFSNSHHYSSK